MRPSRVLSLLVVLILLWTWVRHRGDSPGPPEPAPPNEAAFVNPPDRQGSFSLPPGDAAAGPVPTSAHRPLSDLSDRVERRTGAWFLLRGRILNRAQEPLAGAGLSLYASREPGRAHFYDLLASVSSDHTGEFELSFPQPVEGWIVVEKPGFASQETRLALLEPRIVRRDFILLEASGEIRGRVMDALEGHPASGAEVQVSWSHPLGPGTSLTRSAIAGPGGDFELTGLPEGQLSVQASMPGYFEDQKSVKLETGGVVSDLLLRIVRGEVVSFFVHNPNKSPVTGAQVLRPDHLITYSGDDGRVVFPLVSAEKPFSCEIRARGYLTLTLRIEPREIPEVVYLEPAEPIAGVVTSQDGRPVEGAKLSVWGTRPGGEAFQGLHRSDAFGRFSFPVSDPPLVRLLVSASGFVEEVLEFGKDSAIPEPLEIRLRRGEGAIAGRVVDMQGRPVRSFVVGLRPAGEAFSRFRRPGEVFDTEDGSFLLADLAAGSYGLWVTVFDPVVTPQGDTRRSRRHGGAEVTVPRGMFAEVVVRIADLPAADAASQPPGPPPILSNPTLDPPGLWH